MCLSDMVQRRRVRVEVQEVRRAQVMKGILRTFVHSVNTVCLSCARYYTWWGHSSKSNSLKVVAFIQCTLVCEGDSKKSAVSSPVILSRMHICSKVIYIYIRCIYYIYTHTHLCLYKHTQRHTQAHEAMI